MQGEFYIVRIMKRLEISANCLKWIALITMLIDHFGACIWLYQAKAGWMSFQDPNFYIPYYMLRGIGRLAFPLFIFLLAEGFYYTRNRKKYLIRLTLFAFLSEIPFDLALFLTNPQVSSGQITTWAHQNVYFTLVLGFLSMLLIDWIEKKDWDKKIKIIAVIGAVALPAALAQLIHTDYGAIGVLAIAVAWLLRDRRGNLLEVTGIIFILTFSSSLEALALLDLPLIAAYRGKQGKKGNRWFFYAFYPVHLLLLFALRMLLF